MSRAINSIISGMCSVALGSMSGVSAPSAVGLLESLGVGLGQLGNRDPGLGGGSDDLVVDVGDVPT